MKQFADLVGKIDETTKTSNKVKALTAYFNAADEGDKLWTIALFSGRRPKRCVTTTQLRAWARRTSRHSALVVRRVLSHRGRSGGNHCAGSARSRYPKRQIPTDWIADLITQASASETQKRGFVETAWRSLPNAERFLFNKLITGGFRIGVSQKLMTRALAQSTGQDEAELAHKLMGDWSPQNTSFRALIETDDPAAQQSRPYPFYLAYALENTPENLGNPNHWSAEWKWDGIRGQVILRGGDHYVWSRGEELMTARFPELAQLRDVLPEGTVLDGESLRGTTMPQCPSRHFRNALAEKPYQNRCCAMRP